jgi:hypothetical protein
MLAVGYHSKGTSLIEALRSKLRRTGTKWSSAQLIFDPL